MSAAKGGTITPRRAEQRRVRAPRSAPSRVRPPRPAAAGTSTAHQVRTVILMALLTALLLDSAGIVGVGQGNPPGPTRDLILAVGTPVDAMARAVHLGAPKRWLDAALGHPDLTGGGDMESGRTLGPLDPGAARTSSRTGQGRGTWPRRYGPGRGHAGYVPGRSHRAGQRLRHPTRGHPLRILVTGDSLSSYIGLQLSAITAASHLADVTTIPRDGTGLTNPELFNWEMGARQAVADHHYDAIVMVIGANDGWPMRVNGGQIPSVASMAWIREYERRIVLVENAFAGGDAARRVLWVAPPVPRGLALAHIFARLNSAARFAAPLAPGGQYVDIAGPTSRRRRYTDYLTSPGGHPVLARQPDGVHFTYGGSVFPARVILHALQADFGRLS